MVSSPNSNFQRTFPKGIIEDHKVAKQEENQQRIGRSKIDLSKEEKSV